jgi:hypothetical protein
MLKSIQCETQHVEMFDGVSGLEKLQILEEWRSVVFSLRYELNF